MRAQTKWQLCGRAGNALKVEPRSQLYSLLLKAELLQREQRESAEFPA